MTIPHTTNFLANLWTYEKLKI